MRALQDLLTATLVIPKFSQVGIPTLYTNTYHLTPLAILLNPLTFYRFHRTLTLLGLETRRRRARRTATLQQRSGVLRGSYALGRRTCGASGAHNRAAEGAGEAA
jgi:hypothetical protein